MILRLENLLIIPRKNEFFIGRGMRMRHFSILPGGQIVVKMKGFDRYYFDPCTWEVYSRKGNREFRKLQRCQEDGKPFYFLYKNGNRARVYLDVILRDNLVHIDLDLRENDHTLLSKKDGMRLVS